MVTWFAGLFYLPRLFIYHVQTDDIASRERFSVMERRLFVMMTIGATLTTLFGIALLTINTALLHTTWFGIKLAALAGLFVYHFRCWLWMQRLKATTAIQDTRWLRWFNEIPTAFLLLIIILAVVKPG